MPTSGRPDRAFALGLAAVALVTLWRVALLPFDSADLFVDDAQYWFWGRELAWGYYSKPPLIGWLLRLSTSLGTDAPFWVRLPFPLLHAGTAVVLMAIARRLWGDRAAAVAGAAYVSLPAVALGSLLASTDTPMLLCFALSLLAHRRLAERRSIGWALVLGLSIGTGLLAKYAMVYFPFCAILAAILVPSERIARRDALVAGVVAAALIAPNLLWNATNQFATLHHTADNADWRDSSFDFDELAEFIAGQFAVSGPVIFAAFLASLFALRDQARRWLATFSVPILAIVSVQALVSGANANWAAAAHLAALLLAVAVLLPRPRWLALGLAFNLAVTVALPVAAVYADRWKIGGDLVLARYVGQSALADKAAGIARDAGLDTVVSGNRAYLAAFFYTLRDSGLALYAEPTRGFPPHHYAQKHPLPPGAGDVLYVGREAPACPNAAVTPQEVARWQPAVGFETHEVHAFRVSGACWFP